MEMNRRTFLGTALAAIIGPRVLPSPVKEAPVLLHRVRMDGLYVANKRLLAQPYRMGFTVSQELLDDDLYGVLASG